MKRILIVILLLISIYTVKLNRRTTSHGQQNLMAKQSNHSKRGSDHHHALKRHLKSMKNSSNFIEIPLKKQHKSPEKRLDQFNELSKHQAILLGKEQYTRVEYNKENNLHQTSMIQLRQFNSKPQIIKQTLSTSNISEIEEKKGENNSMSLLRPLGHQKSFLKISESEQLTENENTITDLPLRNHQNTFFTGKVAVGETDAEFDIIFDTGSSLTFINSVNCDDTGCVKGTQYDSYDSDSHQDLGADVEVEFGSGTLKGQMAKENFYVNGMKVPDATFIEITEQVGEVFDDGDFDGIVGLSFPDLGDNTPTLFDSMMESKVIKDPIFSFYMNRVAGTEDSKVVFGGFDSNLIQAEPFYHDVTEEYYWSINAQQIRVGDVDTGICSEEKPCKLVLDSGTSLFTGPSQDLKVLLGHLDSDEGCKDLYNLDDVIFVADGQEYNISPEEYILTVTKDGVESPYEHSDMDKVIECVGAFYALDIDQPAGPLWVMGDVFMSKFYTIFERGVGGNKSRIGLGKTVM